MAFTCQGRTFSLVLNNRVARMMPDYDPEMGHLLRDDTTGFYRISNMREALVQLAIDNPNLADSLDVDRVSQNKLNYPSKWINIQPTINLIASLRRMLGTDMVHELLENTFPNHLRGYYVHESLIDHFLMWLSPDYQLAVSAILSDIRKQENRVLTAEKDSLMQELAAFREESRRKIDELIGYSKSGQEAHADTKRRLIQVDEKLIETKQNLVETKQTLDVVKDTLTTLAKSGIELANTQESTMIDHSKYIIHTTRKWDGGWIMYKKFLEHLKLDKNTNFEDLSRDEQIMRSITPMLSVKCMFYVGFWTRYVNAIKTPNGKEAFGLMYIYAKCTNYNQVRPQLQKSYGDCTAEQMKMFLPKASVMFSDEINQELTIHKSDQMMANLSIEHVVETSYNCKYKRYEIYFAKISSKEAKKSYLKIYESMYESRRQLYQNTFIERVIDSNHDIEINRLREPLLDHMRYVDNQFHVNIRPYIQKYLDIFIETVMINNQRSLYCKPIKLNHKQIGTPTYRSTREDLSDVNLTNQEYKLIRMLDQIMIHVKQDHVADVVKRNICNQEELYAFKLLAGDALNSEIGPNVEEQSSIKESNSASDLEE